MVRISDSSLGSRAHNDYNVHGKYQSFPPTLASPNRQKTKTAKSLVMFEDF